MCARVRTMGGDQVVHDEDNQITMISQLYSGLYGTNPEIPPQQGVGVGVFNQSISSSTTAAGSTVVVLSTAPKAKQRRRRRKKNDNNINSEMGTVGLKKRKLSDEQVNFLEKSFGCEHKLELERKDRLASELGLDPRQVAVWFQNRRARWKNKKLEEEYSKLKSQHDTIFLEKCHLESELLKLRDQLSDAQIEIQRLSILDHTSSNSPSSSMTTMEVAAIDPCPCGGCCGGGGGSVSGHSFLGADQHHQHYDFGGFDGVFYMPDESYNSSIIPYMEWPGNYTL